MFVPVFRSGSGAMVIGNGDVKGVAQGVQLARVFELDGIMLGRSAIGNPFVFMASDTVRNNQGVAYGSAAQNRSSERVLAVVRSQPMYTAEDSCDSICVANSIYATPSRATGAESCASFYMPEQPEKHTRIPYRRRMEALLEHACLFEVGRRLLVRF